MNTWLHGTLPFYIDKTDDVLGRVGLRMRINANLFFFFAKRFEFYVAVDERVRACRLWRVRRSSLGARGCPRWRRMMVPECTHSPSKRLTPSRCALLSRPLRDEPPPFLCAISDLRYSSS